MGKKYFGMTGTAWLAIIAVLYVFGGLSFLGIQKPNLGASIGTGANPTAMANLAGACTGGATPAFDIIAKNRAVPATDVSLEKYILFGGPGGTTNYGGQVGGTAVTTLPFGNQYQVILGMPGGTTFYYNISLTGTFSTCKQTLSSADGALLPVATVPTRFSLYNPGTSTNNTNGSAVAIGTGQTVVLPWVIQCGAADQYCADPNGGYLVVIGLLNTTEFDTTPGMTELLDGNGNAFPRINIPIVDTGGTTPGTVAWKVTPTGDFKSFGTLSMQIKLVAKAAFNPIGKAGNACSGGAGTVGTAGSDFARFKIRASSYTVNSRAGLPIYGVEDDAGTAILPSTTEDVCYS